jgi:WD40 repeat protein
VHLTFSVAQPVATNAGYLYQALQYDGSSEDLAPPHLTSLAFAPDGALLAAGSMSSCAFLWDWRAGALLKASRGHAGAVLGVAWLTADTLATCGTDGAVNVLKVCPSVAPGGGAGARDVQHVYKLRGHGEHVNCVAASPCGRLVCSVSDDKTARVWDVLAVRAWSHAAGV